MINLTFVIVLKIVIPLLYCA